VAFPAAASAAPDPAVAVSVADMPHTVWNRQIPLALFALIALCSCRKQEKAAPVAQVTFATPDDASATLLAAAKSGHRSALTAIFGPDSKDILFTGDAAIDGARLQQFVNAYGQMHRWTRIKAGGQILEVGPDNYPFPIPLGQDSEGRWYFDTAAGKDEILARRIGKNELSAMDASEAIAGAEHEYQQETHDGAKVKEYAHQFVSDPGKHNGLYWPAIEDRAASPLGRMGDFTKLLSTTTSGDQPLLFNGYYHRILTGSGTPASARGFAVLAYPAEYRRSGIMSFLVGENGTLYQKDLGEKTAVIGAAITSVNPADGWTSAKTHTGSGARARQ
jgi:hypothetical protein